MLLSSHILAEVEALCQKVSIIRAGVTVQSGTLAELRQLTRTTVVAETANPVEGLAALDGVHQPEVEGHRVTFDADSGALGAAMQMLSTAGIRSLTAHPPTLEELFLREYGDDVTNSESETTGAPA